MGGFFGGGASVANMVGATSSVAGTAGLVPAPAAGDHKLTLRGDATFYPSNPIMYGPQSSYLVSSNATYWTFPFLGGGSTGTMTTLNCFFCPILIPKQDTYTRIGVTANAGAAGSTIGLALYDNDETNNLPKNLLQKSTTGIATDSAATFEQTISQTLSVGWYHAALIASTSTTLSFRQISDYDFPFYGSIDPWGGRGRTKATSARLTNARSSVTDFPTLISSSDITIQVANNMIALGVRKV